MADPGAHDRLVGGQVAPLSPPAIEVVSDRLEGAYRSAPLGNKRNALDELVYIQLSVRTRERAYQQTYAALRRLVGGSWARLLTAPDDEAVRALAAGGMATVKLQRLRSMFTQIRERFGRVGLAPLRQMDDEAAEQFLRSLPGVGYKVARCVMLYSLDRDVFPVDAHCFRILYRLGWVRPGLAYRQAHNELQDVVPHGVRGQLHVNMVHHGRSVCVAGLPRCTDCVLLDVCPTGVTISSGSPVNAEFPRLARLDGSGA